MQTLRRSRPDFAAAAGAAVILGLLCAAPAAAQSGEGWNPFRTETASYQRRLQDREFVRRWEANPPPGFATLSRANVEATRAAIARYEKIVANGGWGTVPDVDIEPGTTSGHVSALHDRLLTSGDLREPSYYPTYFGGDIETALKRFQATNGLSPTGRLDRRTRAALNISADVRLRQLKLNLTRLRAAVQPDKGRYIAVNIPSAQIEAIENGRVVTRHAGVVGTPERRTPLLTSRIHEINFNPPWHLPPTVINKDLIPKGQELAKQGRDVLKEFGIEAFSDGRRVDTSKINWASGAPRGFTYRQAPGKDNPLGFAKINFHNAYSVYMHDTPSDRLFGSNFRAASSGCIRVDNIETLLAWLLEANDGWDRDRVVKLKETRETMNVSLRRPMPLQFVYITAWATEDGQVQFRRDLYLKDGVGTVAASY